MPSGKPDWDNEKTLTGYLDSSDLMEVAARISGNFRFYRSGNTIFDTHFRTTDDDMIFTKQQAGDDISYYTTRTFTGLRGVKSYGIGTNTRNTLSKYIPYVPTQYAALNSFVSLGAMSSILYVHLYIYTGSTEYLARLSFHDVDKGVYIVKEGLAVEQIAAYQASTTEGDQQWLGFKLWVDVENKQYFKVDIAGTEYDLSGIDLYSSVSTAPPNFYILFVHRNLTAQDDNVYVDSVTLTMNDPS